MGTLGKSTKIIKSVKQNTKKLKEKVYEENI